MANYHDASISKAQKIAGYAMSILFSIQIIIAGVMKLFLAAPIVENMNAVTNWGDKTLFVGILELILLALIFQCDNLQMVLKLLLVAFFLLVTSPTATHAVAHAAYRAGLKPLLGEYRAPELEEDGS